MNENQKHTIEDRSVKIGRFFGRSRSGRLLLSVALAAASIWLAYAVWHDHELCGVVLTVGVLFYGLQLAWRLLPIPESTRRRWSQEKQKAKNCPAWPYRSWFWAGLGIGLVEFLQSSPTKPLIHISFVVPGIFIVVGLVSYILVSRFIRNQHDTPQHER